MRVSVVVRSRDEADRLRLTLTSLAHQTVRAEVIVVDDGSLDHTSVVLAEASSWLPLCIVRHSTPKGRSGAANAGARAASGDIVLFLDGDTLAGPDFVARHAAAHAEHRSIIGRGETFHLRGTRFLLDPEMGTPKAGEEARLAGIPSGELSRLKVTRKEVIDHFDAIDRRATPGIYPGAAPRRLYEIEMDALRHYPTCTVLWAAASGSNLSVNRDQFLSIGGFDEALDLNEHRELALRLCQKGARVVPIESARAYHMTHRAGWRNPLDETEWEEIIYRAHPIMAVKLLSIFWASLNPRYRIPPVAQIRSLPELEVSARGNTDVDYDAVRRLISSLPELPAAIPKDGLDARPRGKQAAQTV